MKALVLSDLPLVNVMSPSSSLSTSSSFRAVFCVTVIVVIESTQQDVLLKSPCSIIRLHVHTSDSVNLISAMYCDVAPFPDFW